MAWFDIKITNLSVKLIQEFPSILETKKRRYLCCSLNEQTKDHLFVLSLPLRSWILNCSFLPKKAISELLRFASVNSRVGGAILPTKTACKLKAFLFSATNLQHKIKATDFFHPRVQLWKVVLQAASVLLQITVSPNPIIQDTVAFKGNWT